MVRPSWKLRATMRLQRALTTLHVIPSGERAVAQPLAKRMAVKPAAFMLGAVPQVSSRDEELATRDGATIRLRIYEPRGASVPVVYAHGGGFIFGGIDAADHICRQLARDAEVVVVSVEYRLAPEHTFPGPLHDVMDTVNWVRTQSWDSSRLYVAGDSAGGNLAAAAAIACRDQHIALAGQILLYPAVDMTTDGKGVRTYKGWGLSAEEIRMCAATYLAGADPRDPLASPLHAADLSGLAPAFVLTAEHDILRWEGQQYVGRLLDADVDVTHMDAPGLIHGSLSAPALHDRGIDEVYCALATFIARRTSSDSSRI